MRKAAYRLLIAFGCLFMLTLPATILESLKKDDAARRIIAASLFSIAGAVLLRAGLRLRTQDY